jgi:hypothetical protein
MSEDHVNVEVADNTVLGDQPVEADNAEANGRRGRPRDPGVIERDTRVLEALQPGESKTKSQLAEELGLGPNVVYLSLWRLHKDEKVTRNQRTWQRV